MHSISKEFHFSAAHRLTHLGRDHKCAHLHGHNYVVRVVLEANELSDDAMVRDYGELSAVKFFIDSQLDHATIVDSDDKQLLSFCVAHNQKHFVIEYPSTAETLAHLLAIEFGAHVPELVAVEVSETPKTSAVFHFEAGQFLLNKVKLDD